LNIYGDGEEWNIIKAKGGFFLKGGKNSGECQLYLSHANKKLAFTKN